MKALIKSLLTFSLIFFSFPLFAGPQENKEVKAECKQAAIDYGIEEKDQADYLTNCLEEYILEQEELKKDAVELEAEQTEDYELEQTNN